MPTELLLRLLQTSSSLPKVYDNITGKVVVTPKAYGKSIKATDLPDGIARFFPVSTDAPDKSTTGLPQSILLPILRGIRDEIAEIRQVYASHEIRMVGGSLLIVYEADWTRAEEGISRLAIVPDEDEEDEETEESDSDSEEAGNGPPYMVKLIDFAHARLAPGEGPDEGVLLGLDTVLRLIDGRISQLS